jgi:casein kinase 1/casein kinase 1 epsilon
MEEKVGRTFKLTKKLGSGAFGEIFQGINVRTNMDIAVKREPVSTKHP